jgi:hypothetical protein
MPKTKTKPNQISNDTFLEFVMKDSNHEKCKSNASKNGGKFEQVVLSLVKMNFEVFNYKDYLKIPEDQLPPRYILKNVPYNGLLSWYADKDKRNKRCGVSKTEYVVVAKDANTTKEIPLDKGEELRVRIECKWQAVSGTVENKMFHCVVDLNYAPEKNIIILMGGAGFKPEMYRLVDDLCKGPVTWSNAPKADPKNINKMDTTIFANWANMAFGSKP